MNSKILLLFLLVVSILFVTAGSVVYDTDGVHRKTSPTTSDIIFAGTADSLDSGYSSAYDFQEYFPREKMFTNVIYQTYFTSPNESDTLKVNIYEYVSIDNGETFIINDTISVITASGYKLIEKELTNSIYDYRKLYIAGADTTNCDSISFKIITRINYTK